LLIFFEVIDLKFWMIAPIEPGTVPFGRRGEASSEEISVPANMLVKDASPLV